MGFHKGHCWVGTMGTLGTHELGHSGSRSASDVKCAGKQDCMMKISLCLIVWNGLRGCQTDVPKLPRDEFEEIFAVDGGSTDGTVEYLESQGIPVYRQPKRGLNAAYVHANDMAGGDAVVVFFAKGTLPTDDLRRFRPLFEHGNELVIASRQVAGSVNEEDRHFWRPRKWAVLGLAAAASLIWRREGAWVRD